MMRVSGAVTGVKRTAEGRLSELELRLVTGQTLTIGTAEGTPLDDFQLDVNIEQVIVTLTYG